MLEAGSESRTGRFLPALDRNRRTLEALAGTFNNIFFFFFNPPGLGAFPGLSS